MEWMVHIHVQMDKKLRAPGPDIDMEVICRPVSRAYCKFLMRGVILAWDWLGSEWW